MAPIATPESEISLLRLYILRAGYLLLIVGLGAMIVPGIVSHPITERGVIAALLGAVWLLAFIGLVHPLRMLPLLLFELTWKSIWLLAVALPLWRAGQLGPDMMETVKACVMGVIIFPLAIPWRYVFNNYLKARGDRWWRVQARSQA